MSERKYKAAPVSRRNIRDLVARIRRITGTENTLYFPIIRFIELVLPQLIDGFTLEILPKEKMPGKCGETFPAEKKIQLREDIYNHAIKGDVPGQAQRTRLGICSSMMWIPFRFAGWNLEKSSRFTKTLNGRPMLSPGNF